MVSAHPDGAAGAARATAELRKAVFSAFIGTVIEWYDFFLYGTAAALVWPKLFFPATDPATATMASFASYAVGFFARPFGSVLFGYIGDKYGRKVTLVWTLSLMGGATFLVGCLPTYATIGAWAPILLVVLRVGQGLAIGGEWGGAALMAVEHGHKGHRGWYGSWAQIGVPTGLLLATGIFSVFSSMGDDFLFHWGWRICFWFGILLTLFGFFVRQRVSETPVFMEAARTGAVARNPLLDALRQEWRQISLVIGVRVAENAGYYILSIFVLSYAEGHGLPRSMVLGGIMLGSAAEFFAIPLYGALSDRIGRRAVCLFGAGLFTLGIFPFFAAFQTRQPDLIWLALVVAFGISHAAMYAPEAAFFSELFSTKVRYSGMSLGYGISSAIAGALAPSIATYLVKLDGGDPWFCATYLAILGVISIISISIAKETNKRVL